MLLTMLGGTLAAGGAHAINQYWDRDIDARMRRTRNRAVVTGKIPARNALIFGTALSVLAFAQLWLTVNLIRGLALEPRRDHMIRIASGVHARAFPAEPPRASASRAARRAPVA